jgi:hypothetical protein
MLAAFTQFRRDFARLSRDFHAPFMQRRRPRISLASRFETNQGEAMNTKRLHMTWPLLAAFWLLASCDGSSEGADPIPQPTTPTRWDPWGLGPIHLAITEQL